jgi:DNA mismatch endonuclease (patch repair protein)
MARIKSGGNRGTELRFISLLQENRVTGWRRGAKVAGKPDFVWPKLRVALFVDGCFWHGCPIHGRVPDSRKEYWEPKLARNAARDREVSRELRKRGWKVLRIWECELASKRAVKTIARVQRALAISERL